LRLFLYAAERLPLLPQLKEPPIAHYLSLNSLSMGVQYNRPCPAITLSRVLLISPRSFSQCILGVASAERTTSRTCKMEP
jgi:hypothetical protein